MRRYLDTDNFNDIYIENNCVNHPSYWRRNHVICNNIYNNEILPNQGCIVDFMLCRLVGWLCFTAYQLLPLI